MDRIEISSDDICAGVVGPRRGEIIDIDGNHFEFHYVEETDENVSTTEVILTNPALVNTEGQICFHQNVISPSNNQTDDNVEYPIVINNPEAQVIPENQTILEPNQNSLINSGLLNSTQPSEDGLIFQLGNSGQFLRLSTPSTENPLQQHQLYLSDISSGQFIKLPELSTATAAVSNRTTSSASGTRVKKKISTVVPGQKNTSSDRAKTSGIITVALSEDEGNTSTSTDTIDINNTSTTVIQNQLSDRDTQLVPKQFSKKPHEYILPNLYPSQTVNVPVPGGLSVEMRRYIFTQGLCRVCLLVKDDMVSLFEDVVIGSTGMIENNRGANSSSRFNIIPAIKTLLDVDVVFGDSLPDQVCMDCLDNLTAFSIFRKKISLGQTKLSEILNQVKNSVHPTVIPPLGDLDTSRTGVFRQAESIICAKKILSTSSFSHFVVRNLSDRIWDKIFVAMSNMVGFKSGKLKELESYCLDTPFVTGWFCMQCNITIHGPRELYLQHFQQIMHVQSSNSKDMNYPCDICGNFFCTIDSTGNSENYAEHWIQHFFFCECDICGKRMPSMKGVWVHKRSAHLKDGGEVFTCPICEKTFLKKAHLVNHEKTHLNPEERKVHMKFCTICEKYLTSSLSAHQARVHSDNRPWKCELCGKTYKRKEILNGHRDTVHSDFKKYQCEICWQFFKSYSTKRLHILRHKGEKPHGCEVCDKRFYTSSSLKSHSVKHKDVADIICNICGKAFKRKIYLVEHLRIHSDVKPHKCPICGKQIRMKSNYFKHLGIHRKRKEQEKLAEGNEEITLLEERVHVTVDSAQNEIKILT